MRIPGIKLIGSTVISVLFLSASSALAAKPPQQAGHLQPKANSTLPVPRAIVPYTSYNFGDVYTGEIISQTFVLKNEGNADLQLNDFKSDCGCTVANSDSVIPPGKEGMAEVEVQTVSQSGSIIKSAILHTNDPSQPTIVFTLRANVLKGSPTRQGKRVGPLFVSPDTKIPMYAAAGRRSRAEFMLTAAGDDVNVLGVEPGSKHFVARVEVIQPGRNYKLVVESLEKENGGLYRDRLRVRTDNPALPAFNVALYLQVYPKE